MARGALTVLLSVLLMGLAAGGAANVLSVGVKNFEETVVNSYNVWVLEYFSARCGARENTRLSGISSSSISDAACLQAPVRSLHPSTPVWLRSTPPSSPSAASTSTRTRAWS